MYMKNVDNVCTQLVKFSGHYYYRRLCKTCYDSQYVEIQHKLK